MIDVRIDLPVPGVDEDRIRFVLESAMESEGAELDLDVTVVDDATIRDLNRRCLEHDWATDVIAFELDGPGEGADGMIVASAETALREAAVRGHTAAGELLLYCVHGALHLMGYDDHEPEDRRRMHERQRGILRSLGVELDEA